MSAPYLRPLLGFLAALLSVGLPAQAQGPGPGTPPPLQPPPAPPQNPITASKTNLGRVLFWDEQLSSSKTIACGTCHIPTEGGSDPRTSVTGMITRHPGPDNLFNTADDSFGSPGVAHMGTNLEFVLDPRFRLDTQVTSRKAQPMHMAAYSPSLLWDGRASGTFVDPLTNSVIVPLGGALESQSLGPILSSVEMGPEGRSWADVTNRLAASTPLRLSPQIPSTISTYVNGRSYPQLFQEAFGSPDITPVRIAFALATYQRSLWTGQAPIDAFFGGQPGALTPQELAGQNVFTGPGRCVICHAGNQFTNHTFRYIGVRPQDDDLGRFLVTNDPVDRGRMKVPSLRNVEQRGPYFHNGGKATLEDVISFYNNGGDFAGPNKDPNIIPLGLSVQQRADLAAFLRRPLTDPRMVSGSGPFERPLLNSEASPARLPVAFGAGTLSSQGFLPLIQADEPAFVGNDRFAVGIDRATPGKAAGLLVSENPNFGGVPFNGTTIFLDLTQGFQLKRIPALSGLNPGDGHGTVSFAIPNDPTKVGVPFYAQFIVLDNPQPGVRFSATQAISSLRF
jgi:cytochrome c peroxidase